MTLPSAQSNEREAAIQIIGILRKNGHTAYLAGGCVRDQLLGETPKDYDVATSAHPEHIAKLFKKTAAVGASFGVMLVRDFGPTIEVATFRSDGPYTDSRRPDHVQFSSPEEDAKRRDFTINALFLNPTKDGDEIIDLVHGQADIQARILRAVGDPHQRLKEDHLRALRAVRFAARYNLSIDPETHAAIRQHASELSGVSVERIGDEVRRMMGHPSRARAAGLMHELQLDRAIFGLSAEHDRLATLMELDPDADAVTGLAAWAYDRLAHPKHNDWRLKLDLSNDESQRLSAVLEIAELLEQTWTQSTTAAKKRLACRTHCCGAIMLLRAINSTIADRVCQEIQSMSDDGIGLDPEPLISGQTLIEMGRLPGKSFKDVLDLVYDAQLEGRVRSFDEACNLASELFVKYNKSDQ